MPKHSSKKLKEKAKAGTEIAAHAAEQNNVHTLVKSCEVKTAKAKSKRKPVKQPDSESSSGSLSGSSSDNL